MQRHPLIRHLLSAAFLMMAQCCSFAQNQPGDERIDVSKIFFAQEIRIQTGVAFIGKNQPAAATYPSLIFRQGGTGNRPVANQDVVKKALVRFTLVNTADTSLSVYFFPGFYFRDILLYRELAGQLQPLPATMPPIREKAGYRLLRVNPGDSVRVVAELHFIKTYINKIRPRLIHPGYLGAFIFGIHNINSESDIVTYIFCGLLLMMILFSLASYFQGANPEFLYYSGYAFFLGFMLFTKALFNYHTEPLNFFLEEYLDFVLQSTGIIFYMLFLQKFLNTARLYPFLHRLYNAGILLLVFSVIAYSYFHYATDNFPAENWVENGTKLILLLFIVVFLAYSLRHWKDKLLRFLFWGNLLYLLFSLVSLGLIVAPQLLPFRGLAGNSLVYYEAGLFFELVFFLAGLNYKNRRRIIEQTRERETLKAQNQLKEYEKEMAVYRAQQEERERISADMHDELGSGMTAIRLMSEIARNKMKENTPQELERISQSADDVLNKMNAIIWSMNSRNDSLDNLLLYIRSYALEYFENTPVSCTVHTPASIPVIELTGEKRRNIFLSVKETLNNVLKHAGAGKVILEAQVNGELVITITDDGKGIDLEKIRHFGNGLKNIAHRMESIGGSFRIENRGGTVTTLRLPL